MSTVQVPVYTTASTAPSYEVIPTTTTMLPPSSVATILPASTMPVGTVAPVSTRKSRSAAPTVASITPITSIPIVATDAGPVYEIELKKRLLDGQRELKEKQADMESDKEKKLEEKADKHRTKAVKWTGRGFPGFAARHEKNATKLDVKANEHYMVAEQLRTQAKAIDRERKAFEPPKEEKKKPAAKNAAMRRPAAPAAGAPAPQRSANQQPRIEKKEVVEQKSVAPVAQQQPSLQKTEQVVEQTPVAPTREVAPAAAAPVEEAAPVETVKTEKKVEETPDGEKKVEKKEEKHHHMLHHKNEQSAGGSSH